MARIAPEQRADAAARLLEAADELLGEKSFEAISVRDVAERAGVNKTLVFYYFTSKADLFDRVLERYYDAHTKALQDAFDAATGPLPERLHGLVDAYLDFIGQNQRYPRVVQQLVAGSEEHHALIQRNLEALFNHITALLSEITPTTGPLAAKHFFVTFSGAVINYFTYAPVLAPGWGADPLSGTALQERREHLHWLVDALLSHLTKTAAPNKNEKRAQ